MYFSLCAGNRNRMDTYILMFQWQPERCHTNDGHHFRLLPARYAIYLVQKCDSAHCSLDTMSICRNARYVLEKGRVMTPSLRIHVAKPVRYQTESLIWLAIS